MYSGYSTQQTLQDERVRDLIANATPANAASEKAQRRNPLARFVARLTAAQEAPALHTHTTPCQQAGA